MDYTPVTAEGLQNLKQHLLELEHQALAAARKVESASAMGDLSENAEFHAAREELANVNSQIGMLKTKISTVRIVDTKDMPAGIAVLGATVDLVDLGNNREVTYTLVGEGEADSTKRRILTTTPIGKALLRAKAGDEISVQVPRGLVRYRVKAVRHE